ncbi:hypothetical protein UFOVP103_25 [uncultured Caudovirales phage]|uniref:Uncharacterized protein n=1 Tax=uncultured Caudovirales phage TaxID=2100421 RepID=A0A6J7WHX5_9CAUD|nr:hypothetical protein UFOVP103_25 [uncultured Caudovirales phage]CAB5216975.1 hypothetical protein UFOVP197_30 [uncultured Caudovirales phage]
MDAVQIKRERALLTCELDEYYKRLEFADRFDNYGDKMWYSELICKIETELNQLERFK